MSQKFSITDSERQHVRDTYFDNGKLRQMPSKEKRKFIVMACIAERFQPDRNYTEHEVNQLIQEVSEDEYVTLRRYLVDYGFVDRTRDGRSYWLRDKDHPKSDVEDGLVES